MSSEYHPPVDRLLEYGEVQFGQGAEWPDYVGEFGLTHDDAPELVRMATDEGLSESPTETAAVWAPLHAWRALGQLGAEEAAAPLLGLLRRLDEQSDDSVSEELPEVFGMLGPGTIPLLEDYLADPSHSLWARTAAARAVAQVGKRPAQRAPAAREAAVAALVRLLGRHEENDPTLNAFVISDLTDLKAVEALPAIREAYQGGCVDFTVIGDYEDVEIHMGVRERRSGPARHPGFREMIFEGAPKTLSEADIDWSKIGRNEPCPCGSGLKFKKCCAGKRET